MIIVNQKIIQMAINTGNLFINVHVGLAEYAA